MSCMSNISIVGVVGSLSFEGDADPISNVQIERIQGSDHITNYHRMRNWGHSGTIKSFIWHFDLFTPKETASNIFCIIL